MTSPLPKHITIVGLGLIGGSLAKAIKLYQPSIIISALSDDNAAVEYALKKNIIDISLNDNIAAIKQSDVVILCIPLLAYPEVLKTIAPELRENTIVTDVGSTKVYALESLKKHIHSSMHPLIVPGHPIAGSEKSGIHASDAHLFTAKQIIVTPSDITDKKALNVIRSLWNTIDAKVETIEIYKHDRIYALTSHLPHLLCFGYALFMHQNGLTKLNSKLKRFLRTADSNAQMWSDVFLCNKEALLSGYKLFKQNFNDLLNKAKSSPSELNESLKATQQYRLEIKLPTTTYQTEYQSIDICEDILPIFTAKALDEMVSMDIHIGAGYRDFTSPILSYIEELTEVSNKDHETLIEKSSELLSFFEKFTDAISHNDKDAILKLIGKSKAIMASLI